MTGNGTERSILDWLASQRAAMLALLETLVNTDGGSYDKAGVDAVGNHIREFLSGNGIASEVTPDTRFGDAISATVGHGGGNRPILLMGHRDTVFPKGEPSRRPADPSRRPGPSRQPPRRLGPGRRTTCRSVRAASVAR